MGKHDKVGASEIVAAVSHEEYYEARIKELESRLNLSEETNLKLTEEIVQYREAVNTVAENAKKAIVKLKDENERLKAKVVKLVETYV